MDFGKHGNMILRESWSLERESDAIIPGLPDDLALRCLAKISHGYHGLLESVSRRWRGVIRSTDYTNLKAKEGWCGNWLLFSTFVGPKSMWNAYDPDADRWHPIPLPTLPKANCEYLGFSCISVCKRFLVIGGYNFSFSSRESMSTNDVMLFDPFKQQWSSVSSMRTARSNFACAVIDDKVYVAGGYYSSEPARLSALSAAEVYDPHMDRWEDLPPMPFPLHKCLNVSHGGKFHVVGKKGGNFEGDTCVVFNPTDQKWRIVEGTCPFSELSRCYTTMADGRIYTVDYDNIVRVVDTKTWDWCPLGAIPDVSLPHHSQPLQPFGFCLIGLRQCLYVVGGMAEGDSGLDVDLNTVRFCDLTIVPLEWHDARPMPEPSCRIIGCALVEE